MSSDDEEEKSQDVSVAESERHMVKAHKGGRKKKGKDLKNAALDLNDQRKEDSPQNEVEDR